jgi:UDP-N-acetylbacillosamine N-acetyltransferase
MSQAIVIWGAGDHAQVVADLVRQQGDFDLVGFLDDANPERAGQAFAGAVILGGADALPGLTARGVTWMALGMGNNPARLHRAELARLHGFQLATLIHPSAVLAASAQIGPGTVIKAGAILEVESRLGASALVSSGVVIAHHCVVEDGVFLSARVVLGGRATIGRGTWLGVGCVVKDRIAIGSGSIIGAGAVVVREIPDGVIAFGVPAKVARMATLEDFCGVARRPTPALGSCPDGSRQAIGRLGPAVA